MTEYEDEDIDEMVDEIFGDIDAGSRPPREYRLGCDRCGDIFTARTKGAKYCPSCRQIVRREASRKGAEKAKPLREPDGTDREAEKQKRARQIEDAVHKLEAVQAEKDGPPRASAPTEPPEGKKWVKIPLGRPLSDFFTAEDIYSRKAGIAGPLRDEVEVVVALEEQICAEHGLTFGQLAEAVAALRHYKAVLARLGAESEENKDA